MAFLDQLRQQGPVAPAPGLELGAPQTNHITDTLSAIEPFISRMRNQQNQDARDMMLFQQVHSPMPDIQGGRIRALADPSQMNTVLGSQGITDFQKASLGQNQQKIDLEKGKAKTAERVGDEKLDVLTGRLALDKEKSDQIYDIKQKELKDKADTAEKNLDLAKQRLLGNENNAMMTSQYHAAQIAAQDARHALDIARKDRELDDKERNTSAHIKDLEDKLKLLQTPTVEKAVESEDEEGNRTVTKTTGKETKPTAPKAPTGWKYIPKTGGGWTAVEDKK